MSINNKIFVQTKVSSKVVIGLKRVAFDFQRIPKTAVVLKYLRISLSFVTKRLKLHKQNVVESTLFF